MKMLIFCMSCSLELEEINDEPVQEEIEIDLDPSRNSHQNEESNNDQQKPIENNNNEDE